MMHKPGCTFWDATCERCCTMKVGDLDNDHFKELMGVTRTQFEYYCHPDLDAGKDSGPVYLSGLYNFWDAIMRALSLPIYFRKLDNEARRLKYED